jgi:hypothetical protein
VVVVGEETHGRLHPEEAMEILRALPNGEDPG